METVNMAKEQVEGLRISGRRDWIRETAFEFCKIAYKEADTKVGVVDIAEMGVDMAVALADRLQGELGEEVWDM